MSDAFNPFSPAEGQPGGPDSTAPAGVAGSDLAGAAGSIAPAGAPAADPATSPIPAGMGREGLGVPSLDASGHVNAPAHIIAGYGSVLPGQPGSVAQATLSGQAASVIQSAVSGLSNQPTVQSQASGGFAAWSQPPAAPGAGEQPYGSIASGQPGIAVSPRIIPARTATSFPPAPAGYQASAYAPPVSADEATSSAERSPFAPPVPAAGAVDEHHVVVTPQPASGVHSTTPDQPSAGYPLRAEGAGTVDSPYAPGERPSPNPAAAPSQMAAMQEMLDRASGIQPSPAVGQGPEPAAPAQFDAFATPVGSSAPVGSSERTGSVGQFAVPPVSAGSSAAVGSLGQVDAPRGSSALAAGSPDNGSVTPASVPAPPGSPAVGSSAPVGSTALPIGSVIQGSSQDQSSSDSGPTLTSAPTANLGSIPPGPIPAGLISPDRPASAPALSPAVPGSYAQVSGPPADAPWAAPSGSAAPFGRPGPSAGTRGKLSTPSHSLHRLANGEFFMDRVAGGRLADKRLWVTLLRIAAWVVAGLALVLGIVNFFVAWDFTALLGAASYRTRGANVGLSLLAMVMTWFTGAVATIMMMVFANMADDVNRTRTNAEARTTATDTSGSVTTE